MGKASEHSVFAFSASPRWIPCPGSMAYPENTAADVDGGVYADEGTAAHTLASWVLKDKRKRCDDFIGQKIKANTREFEVTEEFAMHVQTYVDDVQRRAIGGFLMVERRVTLAGVEGFDESNYGTSDAIMAIDDKESLPLEIRKRRVAADPNEKYERYAYGVVEDLKFGMGEKVYAWQLAQPDDPFTMDIYAEGDEPAKVIPNYQLMMYALACLADIRLLIDEPDYILIVINQPRLGHISELRVPIAVLERFALFAAEALKKAERAMVDGVNYVEAEGDRYLNPGKKQCRWCRALARCPAAAKRVQEETAAGFDVIAEEPPQVPVNAPQIARAMLAVPFVSDWCRAVMAKANEMVAAGIDIIGPDAKPYKFVEGEQGDRKWADEKKAEDALTGVLGPKAYQPQKILTASGASKVLDKKTTKETWNDVFVPLIKRAPGKPVLVMGSDPRPAFSPAADSDEFEEVADE